MKTAIRFVLATFLFLAALGTAHAALEWDKTEAYAEVVRGTAPTVNLEFGFKNTGKKRVNILGITTSCGCTEVVYDSSVIRAGAASTMRMVFTVGDRRGLQEKKVSVMTDASETPTELTLKINILEPTIPAENKSEPSDKSSAH